MPRQFSLPDLGEGITEGQVLRLLVAEGDPVSEDQLLMEVETDKAAVEIPSPHAGVVAQWHVSEKQTINVGDLMVTFGEGGSADASRVLAAAGAHGNDTPAAAPAPVSEPSASTRAPGATPVVTTTPASRRPPASPAVRKLARNHGVDLLTVNGSGPGGRILRTDVERAANGAAGPPAAAAEPTLTAALPAAPLDAPGPGSRVVDPPGRADTDAYGAIRCEPISQTRKAIASIMTHSVNVIPHVTDSDDADVTELDRIRRGYNEAATAEDRVGMLAFVMRAVVRALQRHPVFNASLDESRGEIVYKRYFNIAVGVHTERGLVAPVIRNVDRMGIVEINRTLSALVEKARRGTFALDDTRGATYTISNAGAMGGSRYSTPIITHPQVAVLAIGKSRRQPWVVDDEVVPRLIMPMSHSMDHRLIDGAQEIAFMKQVIGDLENPARLML